MGDTLRPLLHGARLPLGPPLSVWGKWGMAHRAGWGHHEHVPQASVLDWQEELLRIAPQLLELPIAARQAVYDTVARFLREDAENVLALAA